MQFENRFQSKSFNLSSYNEHEKQIESLALKLGIKSISLSHAISPMIRSVPRGLTSKLKKSGS